MARLCRAGGGTRALTLRRALPLGHGASHWEAIHDQWRVGSQPTCLARRLGSHGRCAFGCAVRCGGQRERGSVGLTIENRSALHAAASKQLPAGGPPGAHSRATSSTVPQMCCILEIIGDGPRSS